MGSNPVDILRPDPDADTEVPPVNDEVPGVGVGVVGASEAVTESSGVALPFDIFLSIFLPFFTGKFGFSRSLS